MSGLRITAIVLIALGVLGLVYGQFSYNQNTQSTTIGPIGLTVRERQTVNVPVWGSVVAIAVGSILLMGRRKSYRA